MTADTIAQTILNKNLVVRATTLADVEAVFELYETLLKETTGSSNRTVNEMRISWLTPGFTLKDSARTVFTADNRVVGHIEVWDTGDNPVAPYTWGYVHPDYRGQGIGTHLLQWAKQRAQQAVSRVKGNTPVVLYTTCSGNNARFRDLLESEGMTSKRRVWRMVMEMDEAPPQPDWPDNVTVTTLAEFGDLEAVYQATKRIFQDHSSGYDNAGSGFESFKHWVENAPKHNASLWFLAVKNGQIIGLALGETQSGESHDEGYLSDIGVRREYGASGLKRALLQHTFAAYWQRGQRKVSLHVEGEPQTVPTLFYEQTGMRVERTADYYGKELRSA
jgi:mycothiol synthase